MAPVRSGLSNLVRKGARVGAQRKPRSSGRKTSQSSRPHHRAPPSRPLLLEELQTDLLRLEARVSARLDQAFSELEASDDSQIRHTAMVRRLAYATAALDIGVGPNPELNLFDMISFLEISRSALERYWVPEVFGETGRGILAVFVLSIPEAWVIAANILSEKQRKDLSSFISHWIEAHPEHHSVETLRFSQFPESIREESPELESGGIQKLVQRANRALAAADATRLLAERAFYYSQRAPFLMRLQARVATHELLMDGYRGVKSLPTRRGLSLAGLAFLLYFPLRRWSSGGRFGRVSK